MATLYNFPLKCWSVYYVDSDTEEQSCKTFNVYALDLLDALERAENMLSYIQVFDAHICGCIDTSVFTQHVSSKPKFDMSALTRVLNRARDTDDSSLTVLPREQD